MNFIYFFLKNDTTDKVFILSVVFSAKHRWPLNGNLINTNEPISFDNRLLMNQPKVSNPPNVIRTIDLVKYDLNEPTWTVSQRHLLVYNEYTNHQNLLNLHVKIEWTNKGKSVRIPRMRISMVLNNFEWE